MYFGERGTSLISPKLTNHNISLFAIVVSSCSTDESPAVAFRYISSVPHIDSDKYTLNGKVEFPQNCIPVCLPY